jgi:hypothetical protein
MPFTNNFTHWNFFFIHLLSSTTIILYVLINNLTFFLNFKVSIKVLRGKGPVWQLDIHFAQNSDLKEYFGS